MGDWDKKNRENLIVVDSWYDFSDAVLFRHSHHSKVMNEGTKVVYCKDAKGRLPSVPSKTEVLVKIDYLSKRYDGQYRVEDFNRWKQDAFDNKTWLNKRKNYNGMQYTGNRYTYLDDNQHIRYQYKAPPKI